MPRLSRAESRAQTAERLLASARRTFLLRGYAGASVELIADEAGYSKGAVYSNFDSKEAIFLVLLEQKLTGDIANLGALLDAAGDVESVIAGLGAYLAEREDTLAFTVLAVEFLTQPGLTTEGRARCATLYDQQRSAIAALLDALRALSGQPPLKDPQGAAASVVALTLGLAAQRAIDKTSVTAAGWATLVVRNIRALLAEPG